VTAARYAWDSASVAFSGLNGATECRGAAGLRPFFGFYGGKWRDALKHYPTPAHKTLVEPFAGSAGYAIRHADRMVLLGEKDPVIYGVWHYLIHATPAEILRIPDLEPGQTVADLRVAQEARWLVGFWLNRGVSRPRTGPSAWMRDGIRPGSFWGARVRHTIASQVERIRHWKVFNCSYEDLPFTGEATWFIDPPYQKQGQHYHHGADAIDFAVLRAWCKSRPGQVIVCENEGADWLPFSRLADVKTTRRGSRSVEVIWIGGNTRSTRGRRSSARS
jgi:site-specific DNA-adenine methylase